MNNLVASWEKIPKKKFKDNNNKEKILEEDTSSRILPINTQIENEQLAAIQQQKEKATDIQQQQPIVMTTLTQPTLQYQFAPAITALAQQQNTSTTVGQESVGEKEGKNLKGEISKDPTNPGASEHSIAEDSLTKALLACVQKLSGFQSMAVPPVHSVSDIGEGSQSTPTSQICGTSSSAHVPKSLPPPNIPLVPAFPPPAIDAPATPLANVRAEESDGNGRRSQDNRQRRPYARGVPESGRRPFRQAPPIRGLLEHHLRGLRTRADQIATAASTALNEIEEENREGRGEEYTQDLLAIEGATARLVKSIRTAFSRLPPR